MARQREPERRTYQQGARAEAAAATAERILDATIALIGEAWLDEVTLDRIAERAGVNVRTVIRRFSTRDAVVEAAVARYREALPAREVPAPGDVPAAVALLVEYYERADFLRRGLAQEERFPFLRAGFDETRARHRAWVAAAFAPQLAALPPRARAGRLDELAAVTWAPTWRFLRHESRLTGADAERAFTEIVLAVADRADRAPRGGARAR